MQNYQHASGLYYRYIIHPDEQIQIIVNDVEFTWLDMDNFSELENYDEMSDLELGLHIHNIIIHLLDDIIVYNPDLYKLLMLKNKDN